MDPNLTERIRERAYHIWFASGCPDGEADRHWLVAEREILQSAKAAAPEAARTAIPGKRPISKKASRLLGRSAAKATAALIN